jgi:hypothetical protein
MRFAMIERKVATVSLTTNDNDHGWCPQCGMRSVQITNSSLVCTSPSCGWRDQRTVALERRVRSGGPGLTGKPLASLKARFASTKT